MKHIYIKNFILGTYYGPPAQIMRLRVMYCNPKLTGIVAHYWGTWFCDQVPIAICRSTLDIFNYARLINKIHWEEE